MHEYSHCALILTAYECHPLTIRFFAETFYALLLFLQMHTIYNNTVFHLCMKIYCTLITQTRKMRCFLEIFYVPSGCIKNSIT